jgi:uncharacterized HhH-GPD family protein
MGTRHRAGTVTRGDGTIWGMVARPQRLHFTDDEEADRLLAESPLALVIGFVLDQQVPLQKAFAGPLEMSRRIGGLDARRIADLDPAELEVAFRKPPALHRFPGAMASKVQRVCSIVADRYGGRAERIWTEAGGAEDLRSRLEELPGFGTMKIESLASVLANRFGVEAAQGLVPDHPTLGDVDSPEARAEYQSWKRSMKAAQRSAPGR